MPTLSRNNRDYYNRRLKDLDLERETFISHWKELSEYIDPRRGRFFVTDRNKGERRHNKIVNSRGGQALRNAQSGLFAGIMSPARPWFKLETLNQDLMSRESVRQWLHSVETLLRTIFLDSNLYDMAPTTIREALLFGTGAMSHVDDFDSVARFYAHTVGSYWIAQNDKFEVDTFAQERERTVRQIVETFAAPNGSMNNISQHVRTAWDKGDYDKWYPVIQFIDPNPDYNPNSEESDKLRYRSVWFEKGREKSDSTFLRKSGFHEFPVHVPRWATTGEDVYGTNCPGMIALGDVKSLQIQERRKAQAVDKLVNPPLKGPPSLRDVPISSLPGGVTIYDMDATKEGLGPLYQVEPRLNEMNDVIARTEFRINEAFFVDLFLAITNMEGIQPKNQLELMQRNEERLLMLGPALERLQKDLLAKIVERTFNQAARANILPPPPPELSGTELNVRFISALAQAQRAVEVNTIERTALFAAQLAGMNPEVLDKFDLDEALEQYAHLTGTVPSVIKSDEEVAEVRQARNEAQNAAMTAERDNIAADAALKGTGALKNLADVGS